MIIYKHGDILKSHAEALVNTVNCVGAMGRGIALQFKNAYPENYKAYKKACKLNSVVIGQMFVHEIKSLSMPRYIINFPTKQHWKGKSSINYIEAGLNNLIEIINKYQIHCNSTFRQRSWWIELA